MDCACSVADLFSPGSVNKNSKKKKLNRSELLKMCKPIGSEINEGNLLQTLRLFID